VTLERDVGRLAASMALPQAQFLLRDRLHVGIGLREAAFVSFLTGSAHFSQHM